MSANMDGTELFHCLKNVLGDKDGGFGNTQRVWTTSDNSEEIAKPVEPKETKSKKVKEDLGFDLEGLMTDFPTAKELENESHH